MRKLLLALGLAVLVPLNAQATTITFSATNGTNLSAEVLFNFDNSTGQLIVTLTNTSLVDVLHPVDVLTAVFFDIEGVTLTPVSALLDGSTVFFDDPPPGGNVGGEWAYAGSLSGAPGGASSGISSSGFGLFGNPNFNGVSLDPPLAIDGLNYGITSAGDNPAIGNAAVTGNVPLIHNSVVFTLSYTGTISAIDNVTFQYGTALDEPHLTPDGGTTLMLLGFALAGLGAVARRRK